MTRQIVPAVVIALLSVAGCGDHAPTPSTPTAPSIVVGKVTGVVRGEAPRIGQVARPLRVLAGAKVTVVGGASSGSTATTDANGSYEITASGTFKLRFEDPAFVTSES